MAHALSRKLHVERGLLNQPFRMKYKVNFKVPADQDLTGWEIQFPSGAGFGEGAFDTTVIYHDIFEHWFEESNLFRTSRLAINGEAVAMGIRHSLETNWGLCTQYGAYNLIRGWMWNSVATLKGLLHKSKNLEGALYHVDPNPYRNPMVSIEDYMMEEAVCILKLKDYPKESEILAKDYAFGWAWADEVYGWEQQSAVSRFMENMKLLNEVLDIGSDPYEENVWGLSDMEVKVNLHRSDIRATIKTTYNTIGYVSSNMSEAQVRANCSRIIGT